MALSFKIWRQRWNIDNLLLMRPAMIMIAKDAGNQ
jgi:hypothetical protein